MKYLHYIVSFFILISSIVICTLITNNGIIQKNKISNETHVKIDTVIKKSTYKFKVNNYYKHKLHYQIITDSTGNSFLINITQDSLNYVNAVYLNKIY